MNTPIKAILFDAGKVLIYPKSGHWFITPNFYNFVEKVKFKLISSKRKKAAFKKAGAYLRDCTLIQTKDEEYKHFYEYYNIFSKELPELKLNHETIKNITNDLVYNPKKYKFYEDGISVIKALKKDYKLGVVSDAWPSIIDVFKEEHVYHFFSSFVISSIIGTSKPDPLMYHTALDTLNLLPNQTIFIDDNLHNCIGAKTLGIHAVWLCRNKIQYYINYLLHKNKGCDMIYNLHQLSQLDVLNNNR